MATHILRLTSAALAVVTLFQAPTLTAQVPVVGPVTPAQPPRSHTSVDCKTGTAATIPAVISPSIEIVSGGRSRSAPHNAVMIGIPNLQRVISDGSSMWAMQAEQRRIVRIDPLTGFVMESMQASGTPVDFVVYGEDRIWVLNTNGVLERFRRGSIKPESSFDIGTKGTLLASTGRYLVAIAKDRNSPESGSGPRGEDVVFLDPETGAIIARVMILVEVVPVLASYPPSDFIGSLIDLVPYTGNSVLVPQSTGRTVLVSVDHGMPAASIVTDRSTDGITQGAHLDGVLWTLDSLRGRVYRTFVATGEMILALVVGPGAKQMVHTGRSVWVVTHDRLVEVNAFTGALVREVPLSAVVSSAAFDGRSLITVDANTGLIRRY